MEKQQNNNDDDDDDYDNNNQNIERKREREKSGKYEKITTQYTAHHSTVWYTFMQTSRKQTEECIVFIRWYKFDGCVWGIYDPPTTITIALHMQESTERQQQQCHEKREPKQPTQLQHAEQKEQEKL